MSTPTTVRTILQSTPTPEQVAKTSDTDLKTAQAQQANANAEFKRQLDEFLHTLTQKYGVQEPDISDAEFALNIEHRAGIKEVETAPRADGKRAVYVVVVFDQHQDNQFKRLMRLHKAIGDPISLDTAWNRVYTYGFKPQYNAVVRKFNTLQALKRDQLKTFLLAKLDAGAITGDQFASEYKAKLVDLADEPLIK